MTVAIKHIDCCSDLYKIRYFDITDQVRDFIAETGVKNGTVTVQSQHTTCAVFFEEYVHDEDLKGDDYLQIDLNKGLRRLFPNEDEFNDNYFYPGPKHLDPNRADYPKNAKRPEFLGECLNGPAHLQSTVIGATQQFVIIDGELQVGSFGSIWFVDLDFKRPRKRKVAICVMGE